MRTLNRTPFAFGFRTCMRKPRQYEMTAIVRAKLTLAAKAEPFRSDRFDPASLVALRAEAPEEAAQLDEAMLVLGQGSLSGDRYQDGDDDRVGEVVYPSDFADWKPSAEITFRGRCHLAKPAQRAEVELAVGAWSKKLSVVGTRVLVDRVAGGKATEPALFTDMPIDWAHAYGGPGFAANPIGKGHLGSVVDGEDLYQPPRSERSRVMPAQQLPNVEHASASALESGRPAGFGPLSAQWPERADRRGKRYDERWLAERAPAWAEDFDPRFFQAAPADQQLPGFLRGDETIRLKNLHRTAADFTCALPGLRVRVFVRGKDGNDVEVPMVVDTLHVDGDEGAVYVTWRGLMPTVDLKRTDKAFALIVSEPLGAAKEATAHLATLDAFARDPVGVDGELPAGAREAADALKQLEGASEAEVDAILARDPNALKALLAFIGPITDGATSATAPAMEAANDALAPEKLRAKVKEAILRGRGGGAANAEVTKAKAADARGKLVELRDRLGAPAEIDSAISAVGAHATDATGFAGQDLRGQDFSGRDLSGANFDGANLDEAVFRGTKLVGASLRGAQLSRADLSGADLSGADLSQASLHGTRANGALFAKAKLDAVRLRRASLVDADLSGAKGAMVDLSSCDLSGAKARGLDLEFATFDRCVLDAADLTGARLKAVRFRACSARGVHLADATLVETGFKSTDLSGAKARGVSGERTVFLQCELGGADLDGARLPSGVFIGSNASSALFRGADLRQARFDDATLDGASFQRANLFGAILAKASLARTSFKEASLYSAVVTETSTSSCDLAGATTTAMVTGGASR